MATDKERWKVPKTWDNWLWFRKPTQIAVFGENESDSTSGKAQRS